MHMFEPIFLIMRLSIAMNTCTSKWILICSLPNQVDIQIESKFKLILHI